MSGLANLVRVHEWILDEKRQRLAGLQQLFDRMAGDLEILEEKLAAEREAAGKTLDGALAFQTFIPAALERRDKLRHSIANLEQEIERARDEVGEAFQELKKYQTAQGIQQRQEGEQRRRRENLALDEMGVGLYRRNQAAGDKS
ncbi:MAG TPA: flagellar export protein FliJ [Kiloniellales bacterium]